MRLLKICTALDYEKNGEKRRIWRKVGELFNNDSGKMFIRLYHQPETCFYVFDNDEKPKVEIETGGDQQEE
jgi:hypothetical protein